MRVLYIMDSMLEEDKNLKDISRSSKKDSERKSFSYGAGTLDTPVVLPYTKTNKLITALYMVTDTIDKEEPIRLKLRTLGIEILSDSASLQKRVLSNLNEKINTVLSFLNIASDVGMFSEMNCNILKKEFLELKQSIQGFTTQNHLWLEKFISRPAEINSSIGLASDTPGSDASEYSGLSFKKRQGTRIGVQKGSTLLKALNKVGEGNNSFEILKSKRREEIIAIIKNIKKTGNIEGAAITDIKNAAKNLPDNETGVLASCGEKTLQRELVSMIKDNVLYKKGAKRWSLYFLN